MERSARLLLPFLLGVSLSSVEGAEAQNEPTLHEYVADLASDEVSLLVSSGGAQPDAILYQGEVLPAPAPVPLGADERPMRARAGDGQEREEVGRRSPTFRPDRVTDLNGTVGYYPVFTPSISPFKRITALDSVILEAGTPILAIEDPRRFEIPIVGASAEAPDDRPRDRLWGSVVLDFSEGATVPFPSVSPESRVLTLETVPPTELRLEKDAADNYYATATRPGAGEVRAIFLMDAPRTYFGGPLGEGPVDAWAASVPDLPAAVGADARAFAAEQGLSRESSFRDALRTLTAYFRGFQESADYPRDTGNIYLDLVRSQRGICRHRAYGFVITAHALGMHARFVQNEAHAWVEVERPVGGWLRVDLGGAATGLEEHGANGRPPYEPDVEDQLPRPPAYEAAYDEARRASDARRASQPGASGPTSGAGAGAAGGGTAGGGEGGEGPSGDDGAPPPAPGSPPRGVLTLRLDQSRFEVFRGHELEVTGHGGGEAGGVADLRIVVRLRATGTEDERLIGVTVTNDEGRFRGVFGVPPDLPVGDYRLLVSTPGDASYGPAVAR